MKKCNKYLNELKGLYINFNSLRDAPFIFFSIEASNLLGNIKNEINNSYVNKSKEQFIRYSKILNDKLDELPYDRTKGLIIEIEKWFLKYNYKYHYKNYNIETILNLDPESGIYSDLSYPINMLQSDSSDDNIFALQNDFLSFCKKNIIEDIANYLNEINLEEEYNLLPIIKTKKVSESLLLKGIKLNLGERFRIANKLFNISKKIEEFNIPDKEKDQLLSYILGCNITNARQIKSGIYKAKIREETIDEYLQKFNN